MVNSKLTQLLNRMGENQIRSFEKFIASPYFNEKAELIRIFDLIKGSLPITAERFPEKDSLKQQIWSKLFPTIKFDDVRYRRLISDLTQLLMRFLAQEAFQSDDWEEQLYMLGQMNATELEKHFNGVLRKIEKIQENSTKRNSDFFFRSFKLVSIQHRQLEKKGTKFIDLDRIDNADYFLDCFYIINKLKYYCDYLGYSNFLSIDSLDPPDFEVADRIAKSPFLEEPAIRLFFLTVQMLRQPEEESYFISLRDGLYQDYARLNFDEQHTLFTHLINYCIHLKINRGKSAFYTELFHIYSRAFDLKILMEDELLPVNHYKNLITLGLHLSEFEWVDNFIRNNAALLPEAHQENAVKYNLAILYYHKKEYAKTIEFLRDVELRDISLSLGSKLYLLRSYYELGEFVA